MLIYLEIPPLCSHQKPLALLLGSYHRPNEIAHQDNVGVHITQEIKLGGVLGLLESGVE